MPVTHLTLIGIIASLMTCNLNAAHAAPTASETDDGKSAALSSEKPSPTDAAVIRQAAAKAVERGLRFLAKRQDEAGAWQAFDKPHPAVSALVIKALAQSSSFGPDHPVVRRGTRYLLQHVQPDGGIYEKGGGKRNYHTSVALMALSSLPRDKHAETIHNAQRFLIDLQWDGGEGHEQNSSWYGGAGYGSHKRPDLSNTQIMLEALKQSGLPKDDPAYQRGLVFISRCQMLSGANDQLFAAESDDGGFIYTAANDGESKAGTTVSDGKPQLRSYGSMTYAGFKSLLYAGLTEEDPRVRAAVKWIGTYYTLDANPNMPDAASQQGLYYYFHTFARALHAWGKAEVVDDLGLPHDWRADLSRALVRRQRDDGSWVNAEDRWYEGNADLVTAYSVLALQTVLADIARDDSE